MPVSCRGGTEYLTRTKEIVRTSAAMHVPSLPVYAIARHTTILANDRKE